MARLIKKVLRCRHDFAGLPSYNHHERPPAAFTVGGMVICLDCGQELPANWSDINVPPQAAPGYEAMAALSGTVAES